MLIGCFCNDFGVLLACLWNVFGMLLACFLDVCGMSLDGMFWALLLDEF
jgi:hypothetical protein